MTEWRRCTLFGRIPEPTSVLSVICTPRIAVLLERGAMWVGSEVSAWPWRFMSVLSVWLLALSVIGSSSVFILAESRAHFPCGFIHCRKPAAKSRPVPKPSSRSGWDATPMGQRQWIDIEIQESKYRQCFQVSKFITRLLRHSKQVNREEDGGVHILPELISLCEVTNAEQWRIAASTKSSDDFFLHSSITCS